MRNAAILLTALVLVALFSPDSRASWLVDEGKFHMSVHGQISCQDCHDNMDSGLHPNPRNVSGGAPSSFTADRCSACHNEVLDKLRAGVHGAEKVDEPEKYEICIQCHDPHEQLDRSKELSGEATWSKPPYAQCGAYHSPQSELPALSDEDEACMSCHRLLDPEKAGTLVATYSRCFHCHEDAGTDAQKLTGEKVPLMDRKAFEGTPHGKIDCMTCHPDAAQYNHHEQKKGDCRQCHAPHHEKTAHEAHRGVACQACHLQSIFPVREAESQAVTWEKIRPPADISLIHHMIVSKHKTACNRCHFPGNPVGAAAMILPPKSVLCMPCHTATFSAGDVITLLALAVFVCGFVMAASVWLSGSLPGETSQTHCHKAFTLLKHAAGNVFSRKAVLIISALFYDVFLQRKLYKRSAKRWMIHSLIFFPLLFRLIWGMIGLVASVWTPGWDIAGYMVNKNSPLTAFLFDLTGMMMAVGVFFAFMRGTAARQSQPPGAPHGDRWALSLIGAIVVIGFILEGMRIAMTSNPTGSAYAFAGYAISRLFSGMTGLTDIYGYVWYVHAVLTGLFFAYLPFSRLMHMIMAPVVLVMNSVSEHRNT